RWPCAKCRAATDLKPVRTRMEKAAVGLILMLSMSACGSSGGNGQVDAAPADSAVDAAAPCLRWNPDGGSPSHLSETCLYTDIATKTLASDLIEFSPAYFLWSDGATKRRWVRLPPGERVDTSDMDHWQFPVGTQFFKEFALDGVA